MAPTEIRWTRGKLKKNGSPTYHAESFGVHFVIEKSEWHPSQGYSYENNRARWWEVRTDAKLSNRRTSYDTLADAKRRVARWAASTSRRMK